MRIIAVASCHSDFKTIAVDGSIHSYDRGEDLKKFRATTTAGKNPAVLMGRETWDSLPAKPLTGRLNIVISRRTFDASSLDAQFFTDIREAVVFAETAAHVTDLYVIGGAQIYDYFAENCLLHESILTISNWQPALAHPIAGYSRTTTVAFEHFQHEAVPEQHASAPQKYLHYHYANPEELRVHDMFRELLQTRRLVKTRTQYRAYKRFGNNNLTFDLRKSFPLLTARKQAFRHIFEELMWMLRGQTNVKILQEHKVHVWDMNTTRAVLDKEQKLLNEFDAGPVYGFQWRHHGAEYIDCNQDYGRTGYDQLHEVVNRIMGVRRSIEEGAYVDDRRIILTALNPRDHELGCLYPCVHTVQFDLSPEMELSALVHQRSSDVMLALGWNIASMSLLVNIIAAACGVKCGQLHYTIGNAHIYENQVAACEKYLEQQVYTFPHLHIKKNIHQTAATGERLKFIEDIMYSDIVLYGYVYSPPIKMGEIAV